LTKSDSSRSKRPLPHLAPPLSPRPAGLLGPSILIPIYILLLMVADITFQRSAVTAKGNELSRPRTLFAVVNSATLTGFQQTIGITDYTTVGQTLILTLIIVGILFTLIAGGTAVLRIAKLPHSDRQLVTWAIGGIAITAGIGAVAPLSGTTFDSIFAAISAFGNSGLYIGRLAAANSAATHLILLPLAVLGGLGLPVLMELFHRLRRGPHLSEHSQSVLTWTAGLYIVAVLLLIAGQFPPTSSPPPSWQEIFATASNEALNSRSAGFSFQFATYWPHIAQWLTIGLMFIGASSAGTGGGIKVNTLAVLARGTKNSLAARPVSRTLGIAIIWITLYTAMLAITMSALLITDRQMPPDRLLFLTFSALGNVGLSHDPLTVSDAGLYVLSMAMLAGRIAPVLMLWWMAETISTPEIAVG
jgi:trk system potassium uptake protein